jgi:hypothetical protein
MKVTVWACTPYINSKYKRTIEIDDEDVEGMDNSERDSYIDEIAKDEMWNIVEWGWKVKEEEP